MAWAPCLCHFTLPLSSSGSIVDGPSECRVHTLGAVRTEEPWAFVPDSKQISSAPQEGTLSSEVVCCTNLKRQFKTRGQIHLLYFCPQEMQSMQNICGELSLNIQCLSLFDTLLLVYFLVVFCSHQNLSSIRTRTFSAWFLLFPYHLKQHLAHNRNSVNTNWPNKSLTILLVFQDPA